MKIFKLAQIESTEPSEEYMLENGMLYNADADDVFTFKELIKYKVPLFKNPSEANEFLSQLETTTGRKFGRVPNIDLMRELRYKDTRKEREEAKMESLDERNQRWKQGKF